MVANPEGPVLLCYDGSAHARDAIVRAAPLLAQRAREITRRGCQIARDAGFHAEPVHEPAHGRVADTIIALARREGAGLTVVGARGLGGVRSALLGSVSGGLVHSGAIPVLVMPPSGDGD